MPGLLTLKTDLKSLKYGHDQPNGGDSGQPYIKVDINNVDKTFNRVRLTTFDDGLIRGGTVGALNASVVDTLRIGKFFTDFPKGPLFLAKQVGLQLSNPQLEHKDSLPTNRTGANRPTKGQGILNNAGNSIINVTTALTSLISNTANRAENEVGSTRIYSGLNTLTQIPLNAIGGHVVRHGFLPTEDPSKYYEAVVTQNNFQNDHNRLEQYASNFSLGGMDTIIDKTNYNTDTVITSYIGGPSSVYGIGQTFIRRWTNTNDKFKINLSFSQSHDLAGKTRDDNGQVAVIPFEYRFKGASNHTSSSYASGSFDAIGDPLGLDDRNATSYINDDKTGLYRTPTPTIKITDTIDYGVSQHTESLLSDRDFTDLPTQIDPYNNASSLFFYAKSTDKGQHDRNGTLPSLDNKNDLVTNGPSSYPGANLGSFKYDLANPDTKYTSPTAKTYASIQNEIAADTIGKQKANTHILRDAPLYKYNGGRLKYGVFNRTNDRVEKDDTLALVFTPIDPFTAKNLSDLKFLAYITDYTDTFDSSWSDVKYVGRAEKFYIFNEFKRSISLGFNIPCFNKTELEQKHQKLNKLVSILAGSYGGPDNILLGGIITKLKVGNYIDNQPGIITGLNFSPIQDGSWDLDDKLAFYIKVSFNFTVIHNFLPEYNKPFITVPSGSIAKTKTYTVPEESISYPENTFGGTKPVGF